MASRRLGPWVPLLLALVLVGLGVGVYVTRTAPAPTSLPLTRTLSPGVTAFVVADGTVTAARKGTPTDIRLTVENGTDQSVTLLSLSSPSVGTAFFHVDPDMTNASSTMSGLPLVPLPPHHEVVVSEHGLGAMVLSSHTALEKGATASFMLNWQDHNGVVHQTPVSFEVVARPHNLHFSGMSGMSGMKM